MLCQTLLHNLTLVKGLQWYLTKGRGDEEMKKTIMPHLRLLGKRKTGQQNGKWVEENHESFPKTRGP